LIHEINFNNCRGGSSHCHAETSGICRVSSRILIRKEFARVPVDVEYLFGSSDLSVNQCLSEKDLSFAISQSGGNSRYTSCHELAKSKGATIFGCCVMWLVLPFPCYSRRIIYHWLVRDRSSFYQSNLRRRFSVLIGAGIFDWAFGGGLGYQRGTFQESRYIQLLHELESHTWEVKSITK